MEGGAWFKKKTPLEDISFLVIRKKGSQNVSRSHLWSEDDVPFFIHLCEAPDFDKGQDC